MKAISWRIRILIDTRNTGIWSKGPEVWRAPCYMSESGIAMPSPHAIDLVSDPDTNLIRWELWSGQCHRSDWPSNVVLSDAVRSPTELQQASRSPRPSSAMPSSSLLATSPGWSAAHRRRSGRRSGSGRQTAARDRAARRAPSAR